VSRIPEWGTGGKDGLKCTVSEQNVDFSEGIWPVAGIEDIEETERC